MVGAAFAYLMSVYFHACYFLFFNLGDGMAEYGMEDVAEMQGLHLAVETKLEHSPQIHGFDRL